MAQLHHGQHDRSALPSIIDLACGSWIGMLNAQIWIRRTVAPIAWFALVVADGGCGGQVVGEVSDSDATDVSVQDSQAETGLDSGRATAEADVDASDAWYASTDSASDSEDACIIVKGVCSRADTDKPCTDPAKPYFWACRGFPLTGCDSVGFGVCCPFACLPPTL